MKSILLTLVIVLISFAAVLSAPLEPLDDPILKLLANSGVDIIWDGEFVWIGTSKGLSGTNDNGLTWRSYDSSNGLVKDEISAMAFGNDELWVANSSSILSQGQSIPVGEGFVHTANQGDLFVVDSPHQSTGPGMICYDISVYDTLIYAACFYGGLIYSNDNGSTWQNLFPDSAAQVDFEDSLFQELNNRYFTVMVDGNYSAGDTMVIWAGSAEGINQFQYIDFPGKLASNTIHDISVSPENDEEKSYTWFATDKGLSRTENDGLSYKSYFMSDNLPSNYITAVEAFEDEVWCAGFDMDGTSSTGLVYSLDYGETWNNSVFDASYGPDLKVEEIKWNGYQLWTATERGGLVVDFRAGEGWQKVVLNETETSPDSSFNQIYSVGYYQFPFETEAGDGSDSMFVFAGCGNGFWLIKLDYPYDEIRSAELIPIDTIDQAGRIVVAIDAGSWIEEEISYIEVTMATQENDGEGSNSVLRWQDFGESFDVSFIGEAANQILYTGNILWIASDIGLYRYNRINSTWADIFLTDPGTGFGIETPANTLDFNPDNPRFWVGSDYGLATSQNALPNAWDIDTVNLDQSKFDYNVRATSSLTEGALSGNFVVAIDVQYYDGDRIVWASANSTGASGETNGINVSFDNGVSWDQTITGLSCWNFAFDGSDVYAATSFGLLKTTDFGESWDTLDLLDASSGAEIYPGTGFYGVENADGVIWAASDDGVVSSSDGGISWAIDRTFTEIDGSDVLVYASPVPSSPYSTPGGRVKFHYQFTNSGNVTIKIYDFAMNLVATPVDNIARTGGTQYDSDTWDMKNDNGTIVAAGPYYFKASNSSGEEEWGKILVIP